MTALKPLAKCRPRTESPRDHRGYRIKTVSNQRASKRELAQGRLEYPPTDHQRPATRGECAGGQRPCPFVSCRYHLALDVAPRNGSIKLNHPSLEIDEMPDTCALDVADRGAHNGEQVAAYLNITRERVRQVADVALAKLRARGRVSRLLEYIEAEPEREHSLRTALEQLADEGES